VRQRRRYGMNLQPMFKADKRLGSEFLDATEFYGVLRGLYDPERRQWHVRKSWEKEPTEDEGG
jgi:hypothetical protein